MLADGLLNNLWIKFQGHQLFIFSYRDLWIFLCKFFIFGIEDFYAFTAFRSRLAGFSDLSGWSSSGAGYSDLRFAGFVGYMRSLTLVPVVAAIIVILDLPLALIIPSLSLCSLLL